MDKVTLQSELTSQQATYDGAKAEYEYQEKNFFRNKALHEKQLISDTEYEESKYNYAKAKSTFESSEANLAKAKRNLAYATITSPIDGVVISRAVEEGQTVAAGFETPTLFTIAADLTQMQVIAAVDEADVGGVQEGQRVIFTVDAYPNDTFEGTVTQVRLEATEESNVVTYEVVISAHNPDLKLKPGLTANITIYTAERRNVVNIPLKALRFVPDPPSGKNRHEPEDLPQQEISGNDSLKIVWVQDGQEWKPRKVVVGMDNSVNVEICSGLEAGETVAIDRKSNMVTNSPEFMVKLTPRSACTVSLPTIKLRLMFSNRMISFNPTTCCPKRPPSKMWNYPSCTTPPSRPKKGTNWHRKLLMPLDWPSEKIINPTKCREGNNSG